MPRPSKPPCWRARSPPAKSCAPTDVTIVRRPKAEFAANIITTAEQAIGLAARRAMRPGDVLRQTDLAKAELVARNDNVTITFQVPGITLTMRGKALEGGAHGDTINVLNVQSKRPIQATIAGPGHVVVTATSLVSVTPGDDGAAPRRPDHRPSRIRNAANARQRRVSVMTVESKSAAHSIRSAHAGTMPRRLSEQARR